MLPRRSAARGYGWALEDTSSFVKVLADPATRRLLGAHIIGPQASTLIQPLIQAMCLDNTVDEIAVGVLYIHPALSEVVEQALLALGPVPSESTSGRPDVRPRRPSEGRTARLMPAALPEP